MHAGQGNTPTETQTQDTMTGETGVTTGTRPTKGELRSNPTKTRNRVQNQTVQETDRRGSDGAIQEAGRRSSSGDGKDQGDSNAVARQVQDVQAVARAEHVPTRK